MNLITQTQEASLAISALKVLFSKLIRSCSEDQMCSSDAGTEVRFCSEAGLDGENNEVCENFLYLCWRIEVFGSRIRNLNYGKLINR